MATRSLTVFEGADGKEIAVLYRHHDGYPDGHGRELAGFLSDGIMVNGIRDRNVKQFNGMGCLAAQVIAHFKKEVGAFYLYAAGTRNVREDYVYIVRGQEGLEPTIEVVGEGFNGPASTYKKWIDTPTEQSLD